MVGIAFGSSTIGSLYAFLTPAPDRAPMFGSWGFVELAWNEVFALGLLVYVLARQGRSIAYLGIRPAWPDIARAFVLAAVGMMVAGPVRVAVSAALEPLHVSTAFPTPDLADFVHETSRVTMVGFCVLNALFEELIGRAYVISETTALTGSQAAAIGASVLLQATYHLYQGIPQACAVGATFFVFSIYYVRTRRVAPLVLAHFYLDVVVTFVYAHR